jgi:phage terminase small subunit
VKPVPKTTAKAKAATKNRATPAPRSGGKAADPVIPVTDHPLTPRALRFVDEYLIDLNGTQAATRAGYSSRTANEQATRLLADVRIKAIVDERKRDRQIRIEIDQDKIVLGLLNEITADPNDLVQYRRPPCRCCYGAGNRYQYTPNEIEQARKKHAETLLIAQASGVKLTQDEKEFDEQGGLGYDPRKEPNPDCPECFGEGKGEIFLHDTRKVTGKARSIYAGVHQGKDGLKMILKNQNDARTLLMRHAGMLNDKLKLQGDAENPLIALIKQVSGTGLKPVADPKLGDDDDDAAVEA